MKKKIFTSSYLGLESYLVEVEVDISRGLPMFSIVGMGDTAILESKFRVKAALKNSNYEIVPQKIVVNLSPAGIKKEGAQFDLPIALGIILEMKLLKDKRDIFKDYLFVGELSLDGEVKGVSGTINSVILAKEKFGIRARTLEDKNMRFIPFSAKTRMSGVDYDGVEIRKGAADSMRDYVLQNGGAYSTECDGTVKSISNQGGTPLVVAKNHKILGVIYLKDIIKRGVKEKFADLRKMGIKTIMITGDNPLTAAAIAAEAGVDDFLAEATPEGKLKMIRDFQSKGHLVAMTGDGTNDAPALAQADVAVAMNSGTQAAKEAGNMVDLDSSPTKLIDIVRIGKQLLMTRGSLTTFSIANDVAKYFAIIPALFMGLYPGLSALNIMGLQSPLSAVLSAIIYNALIIIALIPLALKGVKYREVSAGKLLSRNLLIYGLGGLIAPFIFIKLIDMILVLFGLA